MTLLLPKTWKLPREVRDAFGGRVQEQRVLSCDGHLVIVLHRSSSNDELAVVFWRNAAGDWKSTEHGTVEGAFHHVLDGFSDALDGLTNRLSRANVARDFFEVLSVVRPLEHRASELASVLERAHRLSGDDKLVERQWMRARSLSRALSLLLARAEDGRDFDLAQLNEEQADISNQMVVSGQRLNFLIAMLLPMTALTSVFGMNLFNGVSPGASAFLFWGVVFLAVALGAVLSFFVGRMPRQLRRESHLEALLVDLEQRAQSAGPSVSKLGATRNE